MIKCIKWRCIKLKWAFNISYTWWEHPFRHHSIWDLHFLFYLKEDPFQVAEAEKNFLTPHFFILFIYLFCKKGIRLFYLFISDTQIE